MPALISVSRYPNSLHNQTIPFSRNHKFTSNFSNLTQKLSVSSNNHSQISKSCSLSAVAPLEAILFDIDGTLCDSDPIHYLAFREMLQEIGFNGGEAINEEFFIKNISGKHNEELCGVLLPDWEFRKAMKFMDDKEAMFRRLAAEQVKPMPGLQKLCKWIEEQGIRRAAVTNAEKANAELLITMIGLQDFFEIVVLANDCQRPKPYPDPYLKALNSLQVSPNHTFVFEDSVSGIKAGMGAGMQVVGLSTRNPEKTLLDTGAVFTIKNFDEPKLWNILNNLKTNSNHARVST